jgi:hypothetical protein
MSKAVASIRTVCTFVVLSIFLAHSLPTPTRAATPYEAQLAGRIYSILFTMIVGEFGGRTRANTDGTLNKRVCEPGDYDDLREAAKDNTTLIAFHYRCDIVGTSGDSTHVHVIAHPPRGYCEKLKESFETLLAVHVYAVPIGSPDRFTVESKALRLELGAVARELLRGAQLAVTCTDDGRLRVSAPRRQRRW